jgi:hypothetical protein
MAAGGSVAKLATVSVSGQPRSLAAAARASPAVSASTTQARTTSQRPVLPESRTTGPASSRHDQPTSGRPYHSGVHRAGNGQVGDSQRDGDGRRIRFCIGCALIIHLIIQTILLYPSGAVWTDELPNMSRLDPSRAVQVDAEYPTRNRKVVGSNPTSGSKTAGQRALLELLTARRRQAVIPLVGCGAEGAPAPRVQPQMRRRRLGRPVPSSRPRSSPSYRAAGASSSHG